MNRVTISFLFEGEAGNIGGLQTEMNRMLMERFKDWNALFKICGIDILRVVTESKEEIAESINWTKEEWVKYDPETKEVKNSAVN
jgi:hypothetical protein